MNSPSGYRSCDFFLASIDRERSIPHHVGNKGPVAKDFREAEDEACEQGELLFIRSLLSYNTADVYRYALTVARRTLHGPLCPLASTSVLIAPRTTVIWEYTSPSLGQRTLMVRHWLHVLRSLADATRTVWQWEQLRTMKVGGNESATKYFQSHGGTAALASKDPKTKYTSNVATKYKDELKRRVADDAREYVTGHYIAVP